MYFWTNESQAGEVHAVGTRVCRKRHYIHVHADTFGQEDGWTCADREQKWGWKSKSRSKFLWRWVICRGEYKPEWAVAWTRGGIGRRTGGEQRDQTSLCFSSLSQGPRGAEGEREDDLSKQLEPLVWDQEGATRCKWHSLMGRSIVFCSDSGTISYFIKSTFKRSD